MEIMSLKLFLPETSLSQHIISEGWASHGGGDNSHNLQYSLAGTCSALEVGNAFSRGLTAHLMLTKNTPLLHDSSANLFSIFQDNRHLWVGAVLLLGHPYPQRSHNWRCNNSICTLLMMSAESQATLNWILIWR